MPQKIEQLKVGLDEDLAAKIRERFPDMVDFRILRQSVDARRKVHLVYSVEVFGPGESLEPREFLLDRIEDSDLQPVIVGTGPAGLFAAIRFIERGVSCKLIERGSPAEKRIFAINRFWRYGDLNPNNNVCFGEGGAGLYSDGKLITRIKSQHIEYVMDRLIRFGAPEEIRYLANPHVGSDKIRRIIPKIRQYLLDHGCEIFFDQEVNELIIENREVKGVKTKSGDRFLGSHVILATGHSAEEIMFHMEEQGVALEGKSFAMGLRIEHPQHLINHIQYRDAAEHPKLKAANYRLAWNFEDTGVYSFCMCPGGYVLSCATSERSMVSNGMSNFSRGSKWANSAIVVTIDHAKRFGDNDPFAGLRLRQELEARAFQMVQSAGGDKQMPVQRMEDFLKKQISTGEFSTSSPSGVISAPLHNLFPEDLYRNLCRAFEYFNQKMKGFVGPDTLLYGVESRTSCPIRVLRDAHTLESPSHPRLYPCGEGAGFAGGITSAACDGIRVAESIILSGQNR